MIDKMEYNFELEKFYKDFGNHILLSLCKDYNNYFSYKMGKKSKLLKRLSLYRFSEVIENICHSLVETGKYKMYYSIEKKGKEEIINFYSKNINNYDCIIFKMPKIIMSNKKRNNILKKIKLLNSNKMISENSGNLDRLKFLSEMQKKASLEIDKMCNPFYINNSSCFDYYTDFYCIYRKAKTMISQRLLIDYVISEINKLLMNLFELDNEDIIVFNGMTLVELNIIIEDLKLYKTPLPDIANKLYQREITQ